MKKIFAMSALFLGFAGATETLSLSIDKVIAEGSASGNHYYFTTTENGGVWGGCPNIQYLWIPPTNAGAKEFYAAFLTAKASGLKIKATGTCPATNTANASYLVVTSFEMK